jgi:outer membrane protein OmpA-like peptidoglycan-associated protein
VHRILLLITFFLFSISTVADIRKFEAPLDTSMWSLSSSALKCHLTHDIPHYGLATFSSAASRMNNMNFDLSTRRFNPVKISEAVLTAESPTWNHTHESQVLGDVLIFPGNKPITLKDKVAWKILTNLESGLVPTFSYSSFIQETDKYSIALSAVNFQPVYEKFIDCVANLLPYSFDDIAETFVYFEYDRSDFTRETRESLLRIGAWLEVDKSLELILLSGHTDSKGNRRYNEKLGKRRADAVKKFFTDQGINVNIIKTQSFAAIQPFSSNNTPEGRAKNRRVMIKMIK